VIQTAVADRILATDPTRGPRPATTGGARNRLQGQRVLFILPTLGVGGAERQAFLLARELQRNEGASVRIVSVSPPDIPLQLIELCEKEGLSWDRFTLRHTYGERMLQLWDLIRFTRFLRRERPDVLLPYCMFPNIMSALTWRLGGARLCVWNQRDEGRNRVMRVVERMAVGRVNCFISNAEHGAAFLTGELGVASSNVRIVHNGIELPTPKRDAGGWRRELGLGDTDFVACMVANLHVYKDHETLIAAWAQVVAHLSRAGRRAHLLLAGAPGNTSTAIQQQIESNRLSDSVRMLGVVDDVSGLLGAVDVAVFSSFNEGLPNAVLEAMAAGVPVIGTDYAGIREAVGAGGLLAAPRNSADLAAKIVRLAEDSVLRVRSAAEGRLRVTNEFSVGRMANDTIEIIVEEMRRAK
jgi:glycosyltransferase involved in cell wall biosynthesis